MEENILRLRELVSQSDNIVFFGGAGVSTESGIPDFRSADGIYRQKYDYPPEQIMSHSFFMENTAEYYRFHRDKLVIKGAKPNAAHLRLAKLEAEGKLRAVITQNVDGLHQEAGSKTVLELHGSRRRFYCLQCGKRYTNDCIESPQSVPTCDCGGIIRPDVVLFEERLNDDVVSRAIDFIKNAEVFIVGGTSLNVYPAAGLLSYYKGDRLVLVNRDPTPQDYRADLVIRGMIGEVFSKI